MIQINMDNIFKPNNYHYYLMVITVIYRLFCYVHMYFHHIICSPIILCNEYINFLFSFSHHIHFWSQEPGELQGIAEEAGGNGTNGV